MTDKEYWLYLAKIKGLSSGRRKILLEMFGNPKEIFNAEEAELRKLPLLEDYHIDQLINLKRVDYEEEALKLKKAGIDYITVEDTVFPEKLRSIPDAPSFLFV